MQVMLK
ncbi:hypothetical protein E2C01_091025 [Portunus trituberculatus]|nr:hypothetical protein [Portunus trituberculatus]